MSDDTTEQHDTHGDQSRTEGGESALAIVAGLMEERRKYEGWLSALEARRSTTPERVFTRVHGDYSDRLDVVISQLTSHSEGLRVELATLTSKLTTLEDEQQQQRDERAEAELRAHVGELSPDAWKDLAASSDVAIEDLTSRHADLERERARTRELLTEAERPPTPRDAAAVPQDAAPVTMPPSAPVAEPVVRAEPVIAPPPSDQIAQRQSEQPGERTSEQASQHHVEDRPDAISAPPATIPTELTPAVIAAEARMIDQERATQGSTERGDADVTPPPTQNADASRVSSANAGTFDELAFLSSVVDTPTSTEDVPAPTDRPDERARRDSFAQRGEDGDIVNLSGDAGTMLDGASSRHSPLAMNVSGNIPIIIKDKSLEAAKSLKCGECGSMNYPTEWYCERCGAELASL